MPKAFLLVVLTIGLLLSACGKPTEVSNDMPRIIHIATTTLSSEKDGYRLLEAGEVERFLRDHPDDKDILPALIEASKASLKSEASLKDERAPTLEDR